MKFRITRPVTVWISYEVNAFDEDEAAEYDAPDVEVSADGGIVVGIGGELTVYGVDFDSDPTVEEINNGKE